MRRDVYYHIDMDGVLARWNTNDTTYDTFQEGYFLSRIPEPEIIRLVKIFHNVGKHVSILSSVYQNEYAEKEKILWLKRNELGDIPRIFVPYGEKKSDYIESSVDRCNVLLDDFTKNLKEWEVAGNLGFKFYNGINGNNGTWTGNCIHHRMSAETMYRVLTSVGEQWAKEGFAA